MIVRMTPQTSAPNIVFITTDTQGGDVLSCYNEEPRVGIESPELAALRGGEGGGRGGATAATSPTSPVWPLFPQEKLRAYR